jgi:AhpD family alkylhydroperoxidase
MLAEKCGLSKSLVELVHLRASQINGCSVCVDMHARNLTTAGESMQRSFCVAAWRDAPYFAAAERAALALTEAVTRLSDREDPVSNEDWNEAAGHFDQKIVGRPAARHLGHQRLEPIECGNTSSGGRVAQISRGPQMGRGTRSGALRVDASNRSKLADVGVGLSTASTSQVSGGSYS